MASLPKVLLDTDIALLGSKVSTLIAYCKGKDFVLEGIRRRWAEYILPKEPCPSLPRIWKLSRRGTLGRIESKDVVIVWEIKSLKGIIIGEMLTGI